MQKTDDGISYVGDQSNDALDVHFYKDHHDGELVDFIRIKPLGSMSTTVIERPVDEIFKARFATKWDAYINMRDISGTPILEWDEMDFQLRKDFQHQGFEFIEQVAIAPDGAFSRLPGGQTWRTKAILFTNKSKPVVSEELEKLRETNEKQERILKILLDAAPKAVKDAIAEIA
jgi:hypothetical protein